MDSTNNCLKCGHWFLREGRNGNKPAWGTCFHKKAKTTETETCDNYILRVCEFCANFYDMHKNENGRMVGNCLYFSDQMFADYHYCNDFICKGRADELFKQRMAAHKI